MITTAIFALLLCSKPGPAYSCNIARVYFQTVEACRVKEAKVNVNFDRLGYGDSARCVSKDFQTWRDVD